MNSENIITWNLPNWITIFLMVLVGYMVLGLIAQTYHSRKGKSPAKGSPSDVSIFAASGNVVGAY